MPKLTYTFESESNKYTYSCRSHKDIHISFDKGLFDTTKQDIIKFYLNDTTFDTHQNIEILSESLLKTFPKSSFVSKSIRLIRRIPEVFTITPAHLVATKLLNYYLKHEDCHNIKTLQNVRDYLGNAKISYQVYNVWKNIINVEEIPMLIKSESHQQLIQQINGFVQFQNQHGHDGIIASLPDKYWQNPTDVVEPESDLVTDEDEEEEEEEEVFTNKEATNEMKLDPLLFKNVDKFPEKIRKYLPKLQEIVMTVRQDNDITVTQQIDYFASGCIYYILIPLFQLLKEEPKLVLAGGWLYNRHNGVTMKSSDIDIFILKCTPEEYEKVMSKVRQFLNNFSLTHDARLVKRKSVMTIISKLHYNIQFIRTGFEDANQVVQNFDLECAKYYLRSTDGKIVYTNSPGQNHQVLIGNFTRPKRLNVTTSNISSKILTASRMFKYLVKGETLDGDYYDNISEYLKILMSFIEMNSLDQLNNQFKKCYQIKDGVPEEEIAIQSTKILGGIYLGKNFEDLQLTEFKQFNNYNYHKKSSYRHKMTKIGYHALDTFIDDNHSDHYEVLPPIKGIGCPGSFNIHMMKLNWYHNLKVTKPNSISHPFAIYYSKFPAGNCSKERLSILIDETQKTTMEKYLTNMCHTLDHPYKNYHITLDSKLRQSSEPDKYWINVNVPSGTHFQVIDGKGSRNIERANIAQVLSTAPSFNFNITGFQIHYSISRPRHNNGVTELKVSFQYRLMNNKFYVS